jgi:hypothetical protein
LNPSLDLRIIGPAATSQEAAALMAAIERFRRETAGGPAPAAIEPAVNRWKQAALLEGISRQPDQ